MKLDNQQIIDAARRQRDLDTSSMNVQPWPTRRQRFQVPAWLTALPAAAIVGFLFGLFAHKYFSDDAGLLVAATDTVNVTRQVLVPQTPDTVIRYVERPQISKAVKTKKPTSSPLEESASNTSIPNTGRSIDQDNIDYTMLVMR